MTFLLWIHTLRMLRLEGEEGVNDFVTPVFDIIKRNKGQWVNIQ